MKHLRRSKNGSIRQVRISHIAADALDRHLADAAILNGCRIFPRQFVSEAIIEKIKRVIIVKP